MSDIQESLQDAISQFWQRRHLASQRGKSADQGQRSAATSGGHLDPVIDLIERTSIELGGVEPVGVKRARRVPVVPGYFRPEKEWDLLLMKSNQLCAVIELKSHCRPSFGNNFNNRAEEAIGSATDFWTAYRERAITSDSTPWVGYFMLLEDHDTSRKPVKVSEPLFKVREEFKAASYMQRYELLLRRLRLERLYTQTAFVTSTDPSEGSLAIREPAQDLEFLPWLQSLIAHLRGIDPER